MKPPSFSILLGCLVVGTAGVLVATRIGSSHEATEKPQASRSRERTPRPATGISAAQLLKATAQHSRASRDTWVSSLDDAELKRLTRAMIAAYREDDANALNEVPSWLVPLATEWGRRDIKGLFAEMDVLDQDTAFKNLAEQVAIANVRAAAVIGLSESNPQKALQLLPHVEMVDPFTTERDVGKVVETIFRNWAKQNPTQAWQEVSSSSPSGSYLPAEICGLIAGSSESNLHDEMLQWVTTLKRQTAKENPLNSDATVSRNSIDAILKNPNRYDFDTIVRSTALGLAEHDPGKAWAWLNAQSHFNEEIPLIVNLFSNSESMKFMHDWAERQPQEVIAFMSCHSDEINPGHRVSTADVLLSREPETALDMLAGVPDPSQRMKTITKWVVDSCGFEVSSNWPLTESSQPPLPTSEAVRRIMANLNRLRLPESETAAFRLNLEPLINDQVAAKTR